MRGTSPRELLTILVTCRPNLWLKWADFKGSHDAVCSFRKHILFLLLYSDCWLACFPITFPTSAFISSLQRAHQEYFHFMFPVLSFSPPCSSHTSSVLTLSSESYIYLVNLILELHPSPDFLWVAVHPSLLSGLHHL